MLTQFLPVALVALQVETSDCIVFEKQLFSKKYFNPSILELEDGYLLSTRKRDKKGRACDVALFHLDKSFTVDKSYGVLDLGFPKKGPITVQDPRLVKIRDSIYLVYSHYRLNTMLYSKLTFDNGMYRAEKPHYISSFYKKRKGRREKNWTPFEAEHGLHFIYSFHPFRVLDGQGACVSETQNTMRWDYGEVRGGTQAVLYNGEYLTFFHSSLNTSSQYSRDSIAHYFIGACIFSKEAPYRVRRYTKKPIVGKRFYTKTNWRTWRPLRVVFPCGIVIHGDYAYITYGKQDNETWIACIDLQKLSLEES